MIESVLIGFLAGIVFGLYGYFTKSDGDEPLKPKKIARTAIIYGGAGVVVGFHGGEITEQNIEAATASTVVLGEVFDKGYSKLKRKMGE